MSVYYGRSVYRYFSALDENVSFDTPDQARAHDRRAAAIRVLTTPSDGFDRALREGDAALVAALRFLAGEIEDAGRTNRAADTPSSFGDP